MPRLPQRTTLQPALTFKKDGFCSFPRRHGDATEESQRLEPRHVGISKRAFRARLPQMFTLRSTFPTNFLRHLPQNPCEGSINFHRMSQNATLATEFAPCHLSPLPASLTMRFAKKKAQNRTRLKCCAWHAKRHRRSPKCCICATKNAPATQTTFDTS